ncbi:MAG: thiolase family protein [Bdellovibrionaceae bacterium]|nr:thiolase family protein [Pseudobdellovibrionaceae bacterium]
MSLKKVFLVEGLRTPFVKSGKEFADIHPKLLATSNLKELLYKMNFKGDEIDEVVLANTSVLTDAPNIARVVALQAGLHKKTSATTIVKNCGSSLESFIISLSKIQTGLYESIITGGMESMSYIPFFLPYKFTQKLKDFMIAKTVKQKIRSLLSFKKTDLKISHPLMQLLTDPFTGCSMGETAELLAKEFNISRFDQDEFALNSHEKAHKAKDKLKEEMFSFFTEKQVIDTDKGVKVDISKDSMAKFSPFFDKKYGTVTIANSCPVNDGSAMLILMSEERMKSMGLKPLVSVKSSHFMGLEPERMGLGPVYASSVALKKADLSLKDMGLIEINEAFSAQVLACLKAFSSQKFCEEKLGLNKAIGEIDSNKLNVNGGAIAIGHPVSATGARLILTLAKEMKRKQVEFGLASLCIGGGQGGAVILQNVA